MRTAMSAWSSTVKSGESPRDPPWRRSKRLAMAWKVPPQTLPVAFRSTRRPARDSISRAARRENVSSRMRSGGTPCSIRYGHPTRERPGFAGPSARDDQHRTIATGDRLALRRVERVPPAAGGVEHVFEYIRPQGRGSGGSQADERDLAVRFCWIGCVGRRLGDDALPDAGALLALDGFRADPQPLFANLDPDLVGMPGQIVDPGRMTPGTASRADDDPGVVAIGKIAERG